MDPNTFKTIGWFNDDGKSLTYVADIGDTIILSANKKLFVEGVDPNAIPKIFDVLKMKYGSKIILGNSSELDAEKGGEIRLENGSAVYTDNQAKIHVFSGSTLTDCGANFTGRGVTTILFDNGSIYKYHSCRDGLVTDLVIRDSMSVIADSSKIYLGDSCKITFDGPHAFMDLKSHSQIFMGKNTRLEFKNGAYLKADSCTFNSDTAASLAGGIYLENAGNDTKITNCTFSNCKTAIEIKNDVGNGLCDKIISNNVINVPEFGAYGIKCENTQNILVSNNTIMIDYANSNAIGLYIKNSAAGLTESSEEGTLGYGADGFGIHIVKNWIEGGQSSVVIANYLASMPNCYIYGNSFTSINGISFIGRLISGYFKHNNFYNSGSKAVFLYQSAPHFFANNFSGDAANVILAGDSYPNLAPQTTSGTSYWRGGNNHFISNTADNMIVDIGGGGFFSNYGNNYLETSSENFNFYGQLGTAFDTLNCMGNEFMPSYSSSSFLWRNTSDPVAVVGNTSYSVYTPTFSHTQRTLGYGIIDTLYTTSDVNGSADPDEVLFTQADNQKASALYLDAITSYKSLINNFASSAYSVSAISSLWRSYQSLDTSLSTTYKDYLYGDLKLYLEGRISSNLYSHEFETSAYNTVLTCEAQMSNPSLALAGYEFVAEFHPDPTMRLLATWDAEELDDLLTGGNGGGVIENRINVSSLSKYEISRLKDQNETGMLANIKDVQKLEKIYEAEVSKGDIKPVKEVVKNAYIQIRSNNEKMLQTKDNGQPSNEKLSKTGKSEKSDIKRSDLVKAAFDTKISDRARDNKKVRWAFNQEAKEKKQLEDLLLIAGVEKGGATVKGNTGVISSYSLSQNYPNPFNPVTNIKFTIPKQGLVSIKIYDVLGRLVKELLNDVRDAGSYSVVFDGAGFASGVYFYRIEAGSFIATKRMVLVK